MDGYRRLTRTRGVQTIDPVVVSTGVVSARRRRRRPSLARAAGALRLVAFVGVLVIIVGTSVGLASSDQRRDTARTAPVTKAAETSHPTSVADTTPVVDTKIVEPTLRASAKAEEVAPVDEAADEPVAAEVAPTPVAAPAAAPATASATGATPSRALPFTGPFDDGRLLLAGALLVFVGMLVQVAGQPLPGRARARR